MIPILESHNARLMLPKILAGLRISCIRTGLLQSS